MTGRPPAEAPADDEGGRKRRARGEPRRLLLEAARDLFNRKGYGSTSTREIAQLADVSEALIYRNFRTKAGLFREAVVQPFVDAIDEQIERRSSRPPATELTVDDVRDFVGAMYDVFTEHRALAAMVFAADVLVESEVAEAGVIDDVRAAIDRFVTYARAEAGAHDEPIDPATLDLGIRGHLAMVAGVASFGEWYFGDRRPSRQAVVDDLSDWAMARYATPPARLRRR